MLATLFLPTNKNNILVLQCMSHTLLTIIPPILLWNGQKVTPYIIRKNQKHCALFFKYFQESSSPESGLFFFGNRSPSTTLLNHKIKTVRQSQTNSVHTRENMATRQVRREFIIVVVNKTHYHESILLNWTLQQKRRYQQWRLHAIFLSQLSWIVES